MTIGLSVAKNNELMTELFPCDYYNNCILHTNYTTPEFKTD